MVHSHKHIIKNYSDDTVDNIENDDIDDTWFDVESLSDKNNDDVSTFLVIVCMIFFK